MVAEATMQRLISKFGFDHYDFVNLVNHSGGMWVLWNNDNIMANIMIKQHRFIHMLILDTNIQKLVTISSIYAPTKKDENPAFWNHLSQRNFVIDTPWCIIGDFNELENNMEKKGGAPISYSQCKCLPAFLHTFEASSLPVLGRPFT